MSGINLAETLQLVSDTIVESLGFEIAAVNLMDEASQSLVTAAVTGPQEVRERLLHRREGLEGWQKLLAASVPWGRLRFLDHRTSGLDAAEVLSWIPDLPVSDDPDAWHPEDALFAPLEAPDGRLLGMMSVDVPRDGRRPGPATRQAIEAFAVTAALAIEHARLAADARRAGARFHALFDASPAPVGVLDGSRLFVDVNEAYCRFLGRRRDELVGHDPMDFTHPEDRHASDQASTAVRASAVEPGSVPPVEKRYLLPDGTVVWARLHLSPLRTENEPDLVVAQLEDITERKQAEMRLVRQAHHDSLTGLPNRGLVMRRLQVALDTDLATGGLSAVLFCDVDRLKLVNDAHGHAVGDTYLTEVARRITDAVRPDDTVGRLGGDEIAVVLPAVGTPTEAIGVAGRVIEAVRRPLRLGDETFTPSVSLGIAYCVGGACSPDELVARADAAMYVAKTEERGSWHVHETTRPSSAVTLLQLRSDVTSALADGQFVLHYQPVVRLRDRSVIGAEALLRWQHPRRGLLYPGSFLDVILDSEYESQVTDWILGQACRDAARRPAGERRVSVNVSSVQLGRRDLPDVVATSLADSGLAPDQLVLELTEDRLLSRPDGEALIERLHALGVSVAIDDFGTGYAGLQYLQRFPGVDIVKLDKGFVAAIGQDAISEHIVRSVVDLARACERTVIVEGVETAEQARFVTERGAHAAQGWFFGRPVPVELWADAVAQVAGAPAVAS